MYHILLLILKGGWSRKNGIPAGPPNGDRSADRRMLSGARFQAAVGGPRASASKRSKSYFYSASALAGHFQSPPERFAFLEMQITGDVPIKECRTRGQDKFQVISTQMFTPFMKNTLFFEKRRSNVHPFYEEDTIIWEEELQPDVSAETNVHPFYEEYTLLREEEVQPDVSTKANVHPFYEEYTLLWEEMFTPFMKNALFFEKRRSNVHPFYEEYTLTWEEELQPDVSAETNVHPFYEEYTLLWEEEV